MEHISIEKKYNIFLKATALLMIFCVSLAFPTLVIAQQAGDDGFIPVFPNNGTDPDGSQDSLYDDPGEGNTDDSLFPEDDTSSYQDDIGNGTAGDDIYQQQGEYRAPEVNTNSQAYIAQQGAQQQQVNLESARVLGEGLGTCAVSGLFTELFKSALSTGELLVEEAADLIRVPVTDKDVRQLRAKESSAFSLFNRPILGSWDSIGWCLVNIFIEYLGQATVDWINGGFQGNPIFVDDPERFFRDIADIEAGKFIQSIGGGFLCEPFRNNILQSLLNNHNRNYGYGYANACTLSRVVQNIDGFVNGNFSQGGWDGWFAMTQTPQNNYYGSRYFTQQELDRQIYANQNTQRTNLQWGNGFISFKDPETGKITTPGRIIDQQINQRLFNGERRLLIADEFDEIINALVVQLVRVALSEVTKGSNN